MLYQFQGATGKVIERYYTADKVPPLGAKIRHGGRWYTRIVSQGISTADARMKFNGMYPYLSSQYSPKMPGVNTARDPRTGKEKVVIESAKHERDFCARHGLVRD